MYNPTVYFDWAGFLVLEALTFTVEFLALLVMARHKKDVSLGDVFAWTFIMNLTSALIAVPVWIVAGVSLIELTPFSATNTDALAILSAFILIGVAVVMLALNRYGREDSQGETVPTGG